MKVIKNFEMYSVTECGKVYSHSSNKFMKPQVCGRGYYQVHLVSNGKRHTKKVHRLVAETFLVKTGEVVNHKDGNKLNNSLSNLEWTTVGGNNSHAYGTGLRKLPTRDVNPMTKLTSKDVEYICKVFKPRSEFSATALAKRFGVNRSLIYTVLDTATN